MLKVNFIVDIYVYGICYGALTVKSSFNPQKISGRSIQPGSLRFIHRQFPVASHVRGWYGFFYKTLGLFYDGIDCMVL